MQADEKLWDIANYVTGFAIAQTLVTTFAIAKGEWLLLKGAGAHIGAALGALVFTVFYEIAIFWCEINGSKDPGIPQQIWRRVTQGRMFAVALFTILLLVTILGHRRAETLASKNQKAAENQRLV
jgi:ABC-type branched-subunit amino acid transport system permease subunit